MPGAAYRLAAAGLLLASLSAAGAPDPVTALVYLPDGSLLRGGYRAATVLDGESLRPKRRVPLDLARVQDAATSPDGRLLAVSGGTPGESGGLRLLEWPSGRELFRESGAKDLVQAVAFSPDGARLAAAAADGSVALFRLAPAPALERRVTGHTAAALAVAFSPGGELLVTAGADRVVRAWEAAALKPLRSFDAHGGAVAALVFRSSSPGGPAAYCATGSEDRTVRVWQPSIGRMVRIVRGHEGSILALAFSRAGDQLFTAGSEGTIRAVDADSDTVLRSWSAHAGWIYSLAVSPDGRRLASGGSDGQVRQWDTATGRAAP